MVAAVGIVVKMVAAVGFLKTAAFHKVGTLSLLFFGVRACLSTRPHALSILVRVYGHSRSTLKGTGKIVA